MGRGNPENTKLIEQRGDEFWRAFAKQQLQGAPQPKRGRGRPRKIKARDQDGQG